MENMSYRCLMALIFAFLWRKNSNSEHRDQKSTLLNILVGLDQPDKGEVWLSGVKLADLSEKRLCKWRNESLGLFINSIIVTRV